MAFGSPGVYAWEKNQCSLLQEAFDKDPEAHHWAEFFWFRDPGVNTWANEK